MIGVTAETLDRPTFGRKMFISHRYRFVFVQLPHTGGSAIASEICEHYGAERILSKHSAYHEFLGIASPEEKQYKAFAAIRNPMDEAVSIYFKYKTDHDEQFSRARAARGSRSVTRSDLERFDFVQRTGATFPEYFARFYRRPYDNWSRLAHHRFDLVLRFENLQRDFSTMLDMVGATRVRPLPQRNATGERGARHLQYYTPEALARARSVFGPFMERWSYELPPEWGGVPARSRLQFGLLSGPRYAYWRFIRYNSGFRGRVLRRVLGLKVGSPASPSPSD